MKRQKQNKEIRQTNSQEENRTAQDSLRILIVEDQIDCLRNIEAAVRESFGTQYQERFQGFDVARAYNPALELIESTDYNYILLDHNLPENPMKEPKIIREGGSIYDLSDKEAKKFMDREWNFSKRFVKGMGYNLIPIIRQRSQNTLIIGTSSIGEHEKYRLPSPDFSLKKVGAIEDLTHRITDILKLTERRYQLKWQDN